MNLCARSLSEVLVAHLRERPARVSPELQRLSHAFSSGGAVALQQALVSAHLEHALKRHETAKELEVMRPAGVQSTCRPFRMCQSCLT